MHRLVTRSGVPSPLSHPNPAVSSSSRSFLPVSPLQAWSKACAALAEGRGRGTLETTIGTNMMELNVYTAQDAASRALSILSEVENNYLTGKSDIRPDLDAYNAVMDAWAKSRVKEATDNVEQLLKRMVHLSKGGEEGKDEAVNGSREQWETISPNIASFNSAIEAWSYSAKTGASEKAIDILDMLEREYSATGNEKIKPTIRTVNQVINALAKNIAIEQGNLNRRDDAWAAAEKSRELLEKMKTRYDETGDSDYKPDPVTYTTCVDAYARVGHRKAAEAAEKLLEEMINTEGIFPNYRTFTAAITAWSKAPDPYRAEKLLTRMESMYENELASGRKTRRANSLKPNSRTYTAVVTALSRSRDAQKAQKSLKLLKKMLDMHRGGNEGMKPSQFTYNAVIEACARTKGTGDQQVKALKIAFAVRKAMSAAEGVDPNCITYISLLKCVQNLMPRSEERNSVAKAVFLDARQASVVNSRVLREFQMASDRHVFDELAAECLDKQGNVNADQIPSEWSKKAQ